MISSSNSTNHFTNTFHDNNGDLNIEYVNSGVNMCLTSVNSTFILLTVSIEVMSGMALFLNALLVRFLYRIRILHPNVRLLLKNLAIAVFLCSLFMFVRFAIYHPFLILVGFQRMIVQNGICALVEIPFHVCSFALILSITCIGIERLSATVRGKWDSEKTGPGTKVTLVVIWFIAFANSFAYYVYAHLNPKPMCYCQLSLITTQKMFAVNSMLYVFLEISVLFVYWYVYYRNCKDYGNFTINTARHNLHARFQMINNVETTRTLLPVVVVHAFFYTVYLLSLTFVRNFYDMKDKPMIKVNLMLAVHHLIPLEMLIQPILIVQRSEHLKKIAMEMYPRLGCLWGQLPPWLTRLLFGAQAAQAAGQRGSRSRQRRRGAPLGASAKRKPVPSAGGGDSAVVDYRMKPEIHQDILEQIWSYKPMVSSSGGQAGGGGGGGSSNIGPGSAPGDVGDKKLSLKRNSLLKAAAHFKSDELED